MLDAFIFHLLINIRNNVIMASILKVKSTKKTHLDIAYKYKYAVKNLYALSNFLYKFINRPT